LVKSNFSISVITVTYNCDKFLEKTIESVLSQKNVKLDFIIIDGKSNDNTLEIINKYKNNISTFISEKDNGIADAMNKGIKLAKSKILTFLNAGDFYVNENILEDIINSKEKYNWKWCYGFPRLMIDNKKTNFKNEFKKFNKKKFLYITPCNHQCCFFDKDIFDKIGLYITSNDHLMDIDFFLRLLFSNIEPKVLNKFIVWYDTLGHSTKNLSFNNFYYRILLIRKYTNIVSFNYYAILISIYYLRRILSKYFKIIYSKFNYL